MNSTLIKRILSSIILLLSLLIILNIKDIFFIIFLLCVYIISCKEWKNLSGTYFLMLVGWIFLTFSIYTAYEIKVYNNNIIYFLLLICIGSDLGGFIFGKILGGPKLTSISPNKTYAGVFGGFILTIIFSWIYLRVLNFTFFDLTFLNIKFFLVIIFLSFISQFGDLVISYFKRKSKVKDTGKLIPGHGGLLDRIDGMIFVFPVYYLLTLFINL